MEIKWISTKDYSPIYGELVLVYAPKKSFSSPIEDTIFLARRKECSTHRIYSNKKVIIDITDRYYEELQGNGGGYSYQAEEITHWMYLPAKPE